MARYVPLQLRLEAAANKLDPAFGSVDLGGLRRCDYGWQLEAEGMVVQLRW